MEYTVGFPGLGWEITVNRVAFTIGNFPIYWYGVLIGFGLVAAMVYAFYKSKDFGIDADKLMDVVIFGAVAGILGARLYYVVFSPTFEAKTFWDIFDIRDGGLGFYGALIFALASAVLLCRWRKMKFRPVADLVSIGFLIGQGIGRWGNFVNQEAFGTNTKLPWGMISQHTTSYLSRNAADLAERFIEVDPYMPVHPTFLYESIWCIIGVVLITMYIKHRKFDGEIALMYVAWNGAARVLIEGLRTDSLYIGSFKISQVVALLGAFASIAAIVYFRLKIKKSTDPNFMMPYAFTEEWKTEYAGILERQELAKHKRTAKNLTNSGGGAGITPVQTHVDAKEPANMPEGQTAAEAVLANDGAESKNTNPKQGEK